ncbi:decapping and exoribonuclease protein-like [Hyla sarda]|uniref:decapping and exoribonuclease protein-like n=1 Tax=Hyla sarda TaxID=327740 RepID=UPI0024C2C983|nr:decapping and exoribonuclease protein-like [Hyla sarda]
MDKERTDKRGRDQDTSDFPWSKDPNNSSTLKTHPSYYFFDPPLNRKPSEMGYFSLDGKGCYHGDARRLRYFIPPARMDSGGSSLGWDLRDGFEDRYVPCNEDIKLGLEPILTWVKDNRGLLQGNGGSNSNRPVDQDFVTRRGLLSKIMCTPYEPYDNWTLAVTLFKGTLYIDNRETADAYKKRKGRTQDQAKLMYGGYKFESYLCADSPDGTPQPHEVVNTNEAFCSVLHGCLASHSFLVSGEVDCKDQNSANPSPPSCYVELKTSAQIRSQHQDRNFRSYKLLKWWCQSFLLGIPVIVAGFRNQQGRIVSVEKFKTSEIPQIAQNWDPVVCLNFCNAFLNYIKKVVTTDDPRVVFLFSWEPGQDVTYTKEEAPSQYVLPDWYVQELSQI